MTQAVWVAMIESWAWGLMAAGATLVCIYTGVALRWGWWGKPQVPPCRGHHHGWGPR